MYSRNEVKRFLLKMGNFIFMTMKNFILQFSAMKYLSRIQSQLSIADTLGAKKKVAATWRWPLITPKILHYRENTMFLLAHAANIKKVIMQPPTPVIVKQIWKTIVHNTSDNCACAKLNAHNRRYDAVLEIQPRQYSMVWIAW